MSIKQRDPQNVKTITDAVVYISYADDPKVSKNGVLDHTWMTLGILKDDQEIDLNRAMFSPHTRGCSYRHDNIVRNVFVFPAYAGFSDS